MSKNTWLEIDKEGLRKTLSQEDKVFIVNEMKMTKSLEDLKETAAHELGHVIARIISDRNFDSVWVRGVNEGLDKWYGKDPSLAGCVTTYRNGKMTFDGHRVRVRDDDAISVDDYLVGLLAGVAAEEVWAGQEKPRSIIDVSNDYRLTESATDSYGDFRQAQRWVKIGVTEGYFYAKEVWGVLQHFYNKAFYAVRDHKQFLLAAIPLLLRKGVMYTTEVMTLWHGFYQIAPTKKEPKKTKVLDIKDNADEETPMNFTELETFILHDLSSSKVTGSVREDVLTAYGNKKGVGGYNRFAYVDGRRYDVRGISKKYESVLYLLQRMGLVTLDKDSTVTAKVPEGILPPVASGDVWVKDITGLIDVFKSSVDAIADDPAKFLSCDDIAHVVKNYPATSDVIEAFAALESTVKEISALKRQENGVRQAMDILQREVSSFKSDKWNDNIRLRFILELSPAALEAAAVRMKRDYPPKPANWDKMRKKERESCGWSEWRAKWNDDLLDKAEAGTLSDDFESLTSLAYRLTAEAAHAAWRIEAARRHPDQGGSTEASATFGAVWDKVQKLFPKSQAAEAAA